jgi:hypothetical protein
MARINYVIPCWDGDRHQGMDRYFEKDRSLYIRTQLHQFASIKHNLDQITFIRCANSPGYPEFLNALANLPQKINNTDVKYLTSSSNGWSYGAFAQAYDHYRTTFEYYIFCEDDYTIVMDYFDEFLINFLESHPKCGYACSLEHKDNNISFGTVSNGIIRSAALEDNRNYHGGSISHNTQVDFGHGFWHSGWEVCSLCPKIRSPYWAGSEVEPWRGRVIPHCKHGEQDLWVPIQVVLKSKPSS